MKTHQYLAVILRLLALLFFLYSLKSLVTGLIQYTDARFYELTYNSLLVILVFPFIPFAMSVILWKFPTLIAKKIIPKDSDVSVVPEKSFSIFIALIITLGLLFFFYAMVDLVYWLSYFQLKAILISNNTPSIGYGLDSQANFYATIFELFFSLAIILGAKTLASFLYKMAK